MAANTAPIFPLTPNIGQGQLINANTALNGSGTLVTIFTSGANGSRVDQLKAEHLGSNVATVLRLFIGITGINGGAPWLYRELTIAANTLTQTAASIDTYIIPLGLILPANATLQATIGTTVAAGLQLTVEGGNF